MSVGYREQLQRILGRAYSLRGELGGGGMSHVFEAHEAALDRDVVIKVLLPELAVGVNADRFHREVALAARLQHPHIVGVLAAGEGEGLLYYVMPRVEGESLRSRLNRVGRLGVAEAVVILRDVARALAYAHEHGVVHRDIKPENILLSGRAAAVADFGIAKALSASRDNEAPPAAGDRALTQTGTTVGTLAYMSPEQAAGDPATDHRTDIYSFGVVAYEILCGAPPFTGRSPRAILAAHLRDAPQPLRDRRPDVPDALEELIARCLAKDPADRPSSASELVDALEALGPSSGSTATYTGPGRARRHTRRTAVVAGAGLLAAGALFLAFARSGASAGDEIPKSLAVLPFRNLSGDPGNDFLSDGMSEELITALSKISELRVAAPASSFTFKGTEANVGEVARTLGVGAVLTGSVRRSGAHLRVSAQLTKADDGFTLWSDSYDRQMDDVLAVQAEIARAIVQALRVRLLRHERAALAHHATTDVTAYELYLRGRHEWNRRGLESLRRALAYYDSAAAKDARYALAYAGMADVYVVLGTWGYLTTREAGERALDAARRAVALDSASAEAHASLASVLCIYVWDWPRAEAAFRKAIALNPGLATTRYFYSRCLAGRGRVTDALAQALAAISLDPLNVQIATGLAGAYLAAGRYDSAAAVAAEALARDSNHVAGLYWLAWSRAGQRRYTEARAAAERARTASGSSPLLLGSVGSLAAMSGDTAEARRTLRTLAERPAGNAFYLAQVYAALGDRETALRWLETAYEERADGIVLYASLLPCFESIRGDRRFTEILRKATSWQVSGAPLTKPLRLADARAKRPQLRRPGLRTTHRTAPI
ncbi:MAG: protein kinase [Gemmatimonadaceae bacterium]